MKKFFIALSKAIKKCFRAVFGYKKNSNKQKLQFYPKSCDAFYQYAQKRDWENALDELEKAKKQKLVSKERYNLIKAIVLYEMALKEKRNGNIHAYPRHLVLAKELAPSFVPAAMALADFYLDEGQKIKAAKTLQDVWRQNPTLEVAKAYLALYQDDTPVERAQRMESFALYNAKLPGLNNFIKAELNMKAGLYEKAKAEFEIFLIKNPPTKKIAGLIAQLEEKVCHNDEAAVNWKKRVKKSGRECLWVCSYCGKKSTRWQLFCNQCNRFNPFEWKLCVSRKRRRR